MGTAVCHSAEDADRGSDIYIYHDDGALKDQGQGQGPGHLEGATYIKFLYNFSALRWLSK